jgi:DNA-binding MarR family transcriptional regulator
VEREPLEVVDAALVRLRRLWSASSHHEVIDDAGTPVEMSSVLVVEACARHHQAGQEATIGDIASFAGVERSTASRLVDRAVRSGLVTRTAAAHDARSTTLVLTPSGRALRRRATEFRLTWLEECLRDWDTDDVVRFGDLLRRFAEAVGPRGRPGSHPTR